MSRDFIRLLPTFMIFLPMLGSLLLLVTPKRWRDEMAGLLSALTLGIGFVLWRAGGSDLLSVQWVPALGITYSTELSGVSLALAMVVAFMSFIAVLYAARRIPNPGTMLALILAMETGLIGIFAARDLVLFYVFFEDALLPSLLMLAIYGKQHRMRALVKFAAYTLFGSLLMLVSIIGIKYLGGSPTFALADLRAHVLPAGSTQTWLYVAFLTAMAVKLPLWPLHAWLPDFHEQNHDSGIPDVMGTLYKVGGYGVFTFGITLFPDASMELRPILMGLAAFTALYAAWIAFHQADWKRLLAYAGLSHMGFVALGVFSLNETAVIGAMYLLAFQNLYTGALFLGVGMLQERTGSIAVRVGGVMTQAGALGGLTLALWLASIAVPGLAGFIGEFSILLGAYQVYPWLAFLAGITTIAAAAYALTAFQHTFWQARPPGGIPVADLVHTEWLILSLPLAVAIFFGVYSAPALNLMQPAVKAVLTALGGN
ncbi:NADH-quinone oxidoreductase subunit M [Deinococcus metalli]|uniref:NADH dehydrogenase subunit M n=2 Tax=Deinococcus metalli TaxID=1141878 RepID=A0A7W8NNI1_9DEIO|nr:NADH-quinone oxidoreductase subunit M [Deinococcus metalli]GHF46349.1 NADH dehydrogenase subunit M [Deinococcus metalli]